MKQRGISDEDIRMVTYQNALTAFGQSGQIDESDFSQVKQVDQSQKYEGSSILRGGQKPGAGTDSLIIE
jgi:hypothetical protein